MSNSRKVLLAMSLESVKRAPYPDPFGSGAKVLIYSHEYHAWYRAGASGYAIQRDEAGVFEFEDAFARTHHCGPEKGIEYEVLAPESLAPPTIRPLLGDAAPRWTDETKTECGCDSCQHWSPISAHIRAQLDENGRKLFDEMSEHYGHIEMDLDVANAKLDGSWPGWEALKGFKPEFPLDREMEN